MLDLEWKVATREFGERFSLYELKWKPNLLPEGKHIMTDEVLGYVEDANGTGCEISTGIMPDLGVRPRRDVRIFGVTYPKIWVDGKLQPSPQSGLCHSLQEVQVKLGYGDGEP